MYTAAIENASGSVYVLTGDEPVYQVLSIQGLNPPSAQLNITNIVGLDGAKYNSARLNTREIVVTVKINGEVEKNRLNLYKYFVTTEWCRFSYKNDSLDVFIEGYVENVECDQFSNAETAQISILCPSPYFESREEYVEDGSAVSAQFEFPFSIDYDDPVVISELLVASVTNVFNGTDTESGMYIDIDVVGTCQKIVITNTETAQTFELDYVFQNGDRIRINTYKGQKKVLLYRGGNTVNIFAAMKLGSVFFQLKPGDNTFSYQVDDGSNNQKVFIYFRHRALYRGV